MLERLAYLLKHRLPGLFRVVEWVARQLTVLRFGKAISIAQDKVPLSGTEMGLLAEMRVLDAQNPCLLQASLSNLPAEWLKHFRPHPFDHQDIGIGARKRSKKSAAPHGAESVTPIGRITQP